MRLPLTTVVGNGAPFHSTVEFGRNWEPTMLRVKAGPACLLLCGEMVSILGAGPGGKFAATTRVGFRPQSTKPKEQNKIRTLVAMALRRSFICM
jgi:hypothetical protein